MALLPDNESVCRRFQSRMNNVSFKMLVGLFTMGVGCIISFMFTYFNVKPVRKDLPK
jgi:hypothetical protein